ncbi:MAG: RHS repeat-associated core domain-containing protein [Verrucomicrobiales bacterium]|nr:RHS repeat-associated core domain-containing protein [Verrucomicrobiales bacterium]
MGPSQPADARAAGRSRPAGREWDTNTGLYDNRARYYDPDLGRFISEDPIGFAGGDPNLYGYVNNNPLNGTDPLGLSEASESGVLKLPSQIAREAICVAGAEVASVSISAAVSVPSVYVSAAVGRPVEARLILLHESEVAGVSNVKLRPQWRRSSGAGRVPRCRSDGGVTGSRSGCRVQLRWQRSAPCPARPPAQMPRRNGRRTARNPTATWKPACAAGPNPRS